MQWDMDIVCNVLSSNWLVVNLTHWAFFFKDVSECHKVKVNNKVLSRLCHFCNGGMNLDQRGTSSSGATVVIVSVLWQSKVSGFVL